MFNIPIIGEIDGKEIKVFTGRRYRMTVYKDDLNIVYVGRVVKCADNHFLIKTCFGGYWVDFDDIVDIEEIR